MNGQVCFTDKILKIFISLSIIQLIVFIAHCVVICFIQDGACMKCTIVIYVFLIFGKLVKRV